MTQRAFRFHPLQVRMRDRDVRMAVRDWLGVVHAGDVDTRVVEEMGIWSGSVRIDLAVINGKLTGIELKSDSDTLKRLPLQAEIYSKVFDNVIIVVGSKYAERAKSIVPKWWGITIASHVDGVVCLSQDRAPDENPSQDPYLLAKLLWKAEAIQVLKKFGLARGCSAKSIKSIHNLLASELTISDLKHSVRDALKNRSSWLGQNTADNLNVSINTVLNPSS